MGKIFDDLECNVDEVVFLLEEIVEKGDHGSAEEPKLATELSRVMLKARDNFEVSVRAFYKMRDVKEQSRTAQSFLMGGAVYMGDIYQGISNSTIVSRSKVEGAFNRLQDGGKSESAKLLVEIGKRISDTNNAAAGAVYNQMADEISKPTHDRGAVKACWDGLVAILPPLASLSTETIKAFAL